MPGTILKTVDVSLELRMHVVRTCIQQVKFLGSSDRLPDATAAVGCHEGGVGVATDVTPLI
jgi:hypothetical protein